MDGILKPLKRPKRGSLKALKCLKGVPEVCLKRRGFVFVPKPRRRNVMKRFGTEEDEGRRRKRVALLDPQPSFTASGIWRINDTAVGGMKEWPAL